MAETPTRRSQPERYDGPVVGVTYAGVVLVGTAALQAVDGPVRDRLVLAVSTDPDHLLHQPIRALLLSPLVVPSLSGVVLVPALVLALAAVERQFGAKVTIALALLPHMVISVAVSILLEQGELAPERADQAEVGVSYALATTAALALARMRRPWSWLGAGAGTAVLAGLLWHGRSATDAGHVMAWALGLLLAIAIPAGARATSVQILGRAPGEQG